MFSSSSRSRLSANPDGSRNVFCYQCGEFIHKTFENFARALCALCQRVEDGLPLTEQFIRDYKLSKQAHVDVSMLLVDDALPKEAAQRFSLFRSMGGMLMSAIGLKVEAVKAPKSVKIAREKRRPRIFESVNLDTDLGTSMSDLDKQLKGKP